MVDGRVIVLGEALVDLAVPIEGEPSAHLGGGPFNVARTLGRLGVPAAFLACISTDRFGERLVAALHSDGVDSDTVVRSDAPTMLALAELSERGSASYRFYVEGTATPQLTTTAALERMPADASAVCVGTLGLVLEPMAGAAEAVLAAVHGRIPVLVDPNVRPVLIPDRTAYRERLERVLAHADVVKVSDEDLAWLEPDRDPADVCRSWRSLGPSLVVLTRGASGLVAFGDGWTEEAAAPPVEVADTIGAGDSVAGALLAGLHRWGRELLTDRAKVQALLEFAAAVAAVTVSRAGASPPTSAEVAAPW